jgi:hypothetical protein
MSDGYEEQIDELVEQAEGLESGPTKVAILEEAVRLADTHQRPDLGYLIRRMVIEASFFSGHPDRALVAFTWRLAQHDRHPERHPQEDLLWEYKWILVSCASFLQVSRTQIEDMQADMARRYQQAGYSLRPVHRACCYAAMYLGEPQTARERYHLFEQAPRDELSEDPHDEQNFRVQLHAFQGDFEQTLDMAGPILMGRMRVGDGTLAIALSRVLAPLFHLGRLDEAMAAHRRGYRLVHDNRYYLEEVSDHLRLLALTDNLDRALTVFEKHLGWALEAVNMRERLYFLRMGRFLLERLQAAGKTTINARLPKALSSVYQEGGRYETVVLYQWLDGACRELAAGFDARNGNDWYSRRLEEAAGWHGQVKPYPLGNKS